MEPPDQYVNLPLLERGVVAHRPAADAEARLHQVVRPVVVPGA